MVRPLPQEEAGPRLRVIPRRIVSVRMLLLASSVMFFLVLFGAVAIQAQRIEGQRQIDSLDREIVTEQDRFRSLRAEVAVQESPERIMAEAEKLDMVEPGPVAPLVAGSALDPAPTAPGPDAEPTTVPAAAAGADSPDGGTDR